MKTLKPLLTLRVRIFSILIFMASLPFIIPLTLVLFLNIMNTSDQILSVTESPLAVQKQVKSIFDIWEGEGRIPLIQQGEIYGSFPSVLVILYGERGPIYVNPEVLHYFENNPKEDRSMESFDLNTEWEVLKRIHLLSRGFGMGSSLFTYQGESGMVFYRFSDMSPLKGAMQHPFTAFALVTFLLVLVPLFFSGHFLLSLRKNLQVLEEAAARVGQQDFSQPLPVIRDAELKPLYEAFDSMRRRLQETEEQRARFLMSISHDLKTPLTSLQGFTEALQEGVLSTPEERERAYRILSQKGDLLAQRISELVDFAQLQTADWKRRFRSFAVKPFLEDLRDSLSMEASMRGYLWEDHLHIPEATHLWGDENLLARALENLSSNSLRYSPVGTVLRLTGRREGASLILVMEDGGPGIDPAERQKVWEYFYRGDKGRNEPGLGLGLSSVKTIVEAHGGSLDLRESELGGARFTLKLPLEE